MEKIGFTIGKFAPLHKGHQYLIETALKQVDKLYVVLYQTDVVDIPIETRANWIKSLYPQTEIIYAYNPPTKIGLDDESVKVQIDYLKGIIKDIPVTHFFCSEEYGKYVGKYFNIIDVQVDDNRVNVPICASKIRNNIEENKQYLEPMVYNEFKNELFRQ